jgi:hypothetical protein
MDPYLESPATWPDLHARLIAELGRWLGPLLRPRYIVRLEERTYYDPDGLVFVGRPDVAIRRDNASQSPSASAPRPVGLAVEVPMPDIVRESVLEIRLVGGGEVVTVLAVLSPANKRSGRGRRLYLRKRTAVLGSRTHLVEIDLLRAGEPMPVHGSPAEVDYRILISRAEQRPRAELLAFSVREPIPAFMLPLRGGAEPTVDLRQHLDQVYEAGGYDLSTDYNAPPAPPLRSADAAWARALPRPARGA